MLDEYESGLNTVGRCARTRTFLICDLSDLHRNCQDTTGHKANEVLGAEAEERLLKN